MPRLFFILQLKRLLILCGLLPLILVPASGQSFKERSTEAFTQGDTTRQLAVLQEWAAADDQDPELHIAYFNYHFNRARQEVLELGQDPHGEEVLVIQGQDSDGPAGFIYGSTIYDPAEVAKGLASIDQGISLAPDRLDMRFGKIYALGQIEDHERFTKEVIATVDHGAQIDHQWKWTDGEPLPDPQSFMLDNVQAYISQLYNTGDDALLENIMQISMKILEYHPEHIESLSNSAVVHLLREEYEEALGLLQKAVELEPEDTILRMNIARAYTLLGEKENAIGHYRWVLQHGAPDDKAFAEQQIKELED